MSQEDIDSLTNASAIIERFGGIRPMATKMGVAVTTVQGWKKRDVIPAARRDDVLNAARENDILIADLIMGGAATDTASGDIVSDGVVAASESAFVDVKPAESETPAPRITIEPIIEPKARPLPSSFTTDVDATHEELLNAIARGHKKAVNASLWSTAIFVVLVGAGAAWMLWPAAQKIERHDTQLATIEGKMASIDNDVQGMNETANFLKGMVPEEVLARMNDLRDQADTIQKAVTDVAIQAEDIRSAVLATDAGNMGDRLSILEAKFNEMKGGEQLAELTARIRGLEATFAGQGQLSASIDELRKIVDSLDGQVNTIETELAQVQEKPQSPLGDTLQGVSGNDLKAAAMLIAFSQLRESLNRSEPFKDDIVLLQKLAGDNNPELQSALTKLAPQAERGGVLTSEGLSNEFKTMAGDIVFSSLKGEDVSITEKAKVRLTEIVNVKKDGAVIGGNATQQTVAAAQAQLDAGDVQGAIATLQSLDGAAKTTAAPFIEQAQASLLAEQVQNILRQTILANVGADVPSAAGDSAVPTSFNLQDVPAKIKNALPGMQDDMVEDTESGFRITPAPQGFKGLSAGQSE